MKFILEPDKVMHLKLGLLWSVLALMMVLAGKYVGVGQAIIAGSVVNAWGVERYQAIRMEGTPCRMDMLASALPGILLGAAIAVFDVFR